MEFGNAMLAWGTAAVAVPIIIHLINRRKFKRVIWAAMKFVQLSIDQNQRRMKLEDWILLFLRCALLVLLALALARPRMTGTQSAFFGGEGEVASVLVLDNSFSMGLVDGGQTRFDQAKAASEKILDTLPDDSAVAFFLASDVVDERVKKPSLEIEDVRERIANAPLSDRGTLLLPALEKAIATLKGGTAPNKEVYVVSDESANGWRRGREIQALLEAHKDEITVHFIMVGAGRAAPANLSVTSLRPADDQVIKVAPHSHQFRVEVANHSDHNQTNIQVTLRTGAKDEAPLRKTVDIPPWGTGTATLLVTFPEPGLHTVTASVKPGEAEGMAVSDNLATDDSRTIVVNAIEVAEVLLVNGGENLEQPDFDDAWLLKHALEPRGEGRDFYVRTRTVPADHPDLAGLNLENYEAVALVNVKSLPRVGGNATGFMRTLANFVADGKGLMIFPGNSLGETASRDDFYNGWLHQELGLLPAKYGPVAGDPDQNKNYTTLDVASLSHPVLEAWSNLGSLGGAFGDDLRDNVRFYRHHVLEIPRQAAEGDLEEFDAPRNGKSAGVKKWRVKGESSPYSGWVVYRKSDAEARPLVRFRDGLPVASDASGEGTRIGLPQVVLRYRGTEHTMRSGETLDDLAGLYAVTRDALEAANPELDAGGALDAGARIQIPTSRPAVVEAEWGLGRVFQFSSTADSEWCNLPSSPHVVTLMHPILSSLLRKKVAGLNVPVGAPLKHTMLRQVESGLESQVVEPGKSIDAAEFKRVDRSGGQHVFQHKGTDHAGVYRVSFQYPKTGQARAEPPGDLVFAVQLDVRESDLRPLNGQTRDQLQVHATVHDWPGADLAGELPEDRRGAGLWKPLILLVLLIAAVEIWAAQRFSRPK